MMFRSAAPKTAASRRLSSSHPYHISRRTVTPYRSMSLMPRSFFPPSPFTSSRNAGSGGEFSSLFRLLDDYTDHITRRFDDSFFQGPEASKQVTSFAPRFDIRETNEGYYLDGEVPGIEKEGLQIEFVDEKTLQIRGRTERSFSSGTPPTDVDVSMTGAAAETNTAANEATSTTPATEPAANADGAETTKAVTQSSETATPATQTENTNNNNERYWVTERSVGEFSRTFAFPTPVDQEAVKASLKNGVLSIMVPKKVTEETVRRITIE